MPDCLEIYKNVELARPRPVRIGMHFTSFAIRTSYKPPLQANLKSCQGMNLFKMLDERTKHPVYQENMQAANTRVSKIISHGKTEVQK